MTEQPRQQERSWLADDDEINLLEYWLVIWKHRKFVLKMTGILVLATLVVLLVLPNKYTATGVITPVSSSKDSSSTLTALAAQFGGLATALLGTPTSTAEIVNYLNSKVLRERVLVYHQLLPVLFPDQWDTEKKKWRDDYYPLNPLYYVGRVKAHVAYWLDPKGKFDEGYPTVWDGFREFEDMVTVTSDDKQNMVTISVDFTDPEMAAKIASAFLKELNEHMSGEAGRVAQVNRKYLDDQLNRTLDPLIRQNIYNMIAKQIETSMTAEVKENFAFKIIDPPRPPDEKSKPKRAIILVISVFVALFVSVVTVFVMEFVKKIKTEMKETEHE